MMKSMGLESSKRGMSGSWSPTDTLNGWGVRLATKLKLDRSNYHMVRHVALPTGNGTDEVDHIIVSPFGVFVVETTTMRGRIFGGAEQKAWVQQSGKRKHAFANPLVRANRHARVVAAMLGLDAGKVFPVLAFVSGATFESPMPANVTRGSDYVRYIKSKSVPIITKAAVALIVQRLEAGLTGPSARAGAEQEEPAKAPAKTCPRCGSPMVLRVATKGKQAGKRFWACSTFPACRAAVAVVAPPAAAKASPKPASSDFGPPKFK